MRFAWLVSDGSTLVAVCAGAAGNDPEQGRLAIVRQNLVQGAQTVNVIDAGKTGALTLVNPPTGAAVETSAQVGSIEFRGVHGAAGSLQLASDTLEVH